MYQSMIGKSGDIGKPASAKAHMDQILKTNLTFYIFLFKDILL